MNSLIYRVPNVGRVLHFYPPVVSPAGAWAPGQPHAAIITMVWSQTCVNLAVFDQNGNSHSRTSVFLASDGMPRPNGGNFAVWPDVPPPATLPVYPQEPAPKPGPVHQAFERYDPLPAFIADDAAPPPTPSYSSSDSGTAASPD